MRHRGRLGLALAGGLGVVATLLARSARCEEPPLAPSDVTALQEGLSSQDLAVRRQAAYGLALRGAEAGPAAMALARALRDEDDYVRETAGRALAKLAQSSMGTALRPALPALLDGLGDARGPVRREAVSLLFQAGNPPPPLDAPLVEPLRRALRDGDPFVRANAAASLGQLVPAASAAGPDLAAALGDPAEEVRTWAAMALASLGAAPAAEALAARLEDPSAKVRAAAAVALGTLGAEVARWLRALRALATDPDKDVRASGLNALGACLEPEALPVLLHGLDDAEASVRVAAWSALAAPGLAGAARVPALLERPRDAEASVREARASALGALGSPLAVPALRAALEDASPAVRTQAAFALSLVGPEGLEALHELEAALFDMEPGVRMIAALTLGKHGPRARRALPALRRALEDPEPLALGNVLYALGAVAAGDPRAAALVLPDLRRALASPAPSVRGYAAQALARLGPAGAPCLPALLEAWRRGPPLELHAAVAAALAALGPAAAEAAPLLRPALAAEPLDAPSLLALARIAATPDDVARVVARLGQELDAEGATAFTAAFTLARMGSAAGAARNALEASVARGRSSAPLADLALALVEGPEAGRPRLRTLLEGAHAATVLRALDPPGPDVLPFAPELVRVLREGATELRVLAARALAGGARTLGAQAVGGVIGDPEQTAALLQRLAGDSAPALRLAAADLRDALRGP